MVPLAEEGMLSRLIPLRLRFAGALSSEESESVPADVVCLLVCFLVITTATGTAIAARMRSRIPIPSHHRLRL